MFIHTRGIFARVISMSALKSQLSVYQICTCKQNFHSSFTFCLSFTCSIRLIKWFVLFDCYTKQISEIHRCILSQVHARKSIFRKIQFYTLHSLKWRVWANYSIARSWVLRFRLIKGHFKKIRPLIFLGQRFSFGCQMFSKIQYKRVILFL